MKSTSFKLKIENPCHEKWEKMHLNTAGKFCDSCQKNVIDFTTKTPREIAQIISEANGKACGRFTARQLELEYSVIIPLHNESNWYASVAASFLVMLGVKTTHAQDTSVKTPLVITEKRETPLLIGDTVIVEQRVEEKVYRIEGQMVDAETGEPIPFQKISDITRRFGAFSDVDGKFVMNIHSSSLSDSLQIIVGGHEFIEQRLTLFKSDFDREGKLRMNFELMPTESIEIMGIIVVEPKRIKKNQKKRELILYCSYTSSKQPQNVSATSANISLECA